MLRLDEWLVKNQIFSSRSKAIRFIKENGLKINDKLVTKPSKRIKSTDSIKFDTQAIFDFTKPIGYRKLEFVINQLEDPVFSNENVCLDINGVFTNN